MGGFGISQDGREVKALHAERLLLFLSYLFIHFDSAPSRKQISFLFWADSTEEQARTNLRNILHHLRRALPEIDSFLEISNQHIRLRNDADVRLDIRSFKTALTAARSSNSDAERIRYLQEAVTYYRGELLPGFYEDWILAAREEYHQGYINALFELSKLFEDNRQYTDAIQAVNRLIRSDPLNESAYQQAMRLYALTNDRAGALQVYHACSTVLMRELGVEPSVEIQRLHEQLIRSEGILDGEGRKDQAPDARRLIGRKQEWGRMREAWQSILKGKPGMMIILGEAGIGKSRLASEMMQWARRQGIVTAFAQCYPLEGNLSFGPVVSWLRTPEVQSEVDALAPLWKKELARLLPEFEMGGAGDISEKKWQKQRLFEAVAKGLLGSGTPRLLVLDDAQWSDQETLEFIHYLLRYAAQTPLMILVTARVEELDDNHPFQQLRLTSQSRKQLEELELGPLNKMEFGLLARDVTGTDLSETKQAELYAETEGNPFFIVETLRSTEDNRDGIFPHNLRSVLTQRLKQLSASARELVGVASAIGREFDYSLLARSSQMDENLLVQALDELWARRIIQTREDGTYSFSHGKLLEAAYEALTLPRRQMFHRKIAEALLEQELATENAIFARHFELAGEYQKSFEAYLKAAINARQVFANHAAISHLEKALSIAQERLVNQTSVSSQAMLDAQEMLGDLYELGSDSKRALEFYSEFFKQSKSADPLTQGRLLGKLAKVTVNEGAHEKGMLQFDDALKIMGKPPELNDRDWWHTWLKIQFDRVWLHYEQGDVDGTERLLEAIRPVVERMGELDKLGEYYFLMPTIYFRRDGYQMNEEIMRYSTLALEISQKTDNLELRTRTNFGYGFCNFLLGRFEPAIQYIEEGLKLADQIGYMEQQIYCLTYLAAAHRCAENLDDCRTYAERAVLICERENEQSFLATAYANLGWIAWKGGDVRQARELSQKAVAGWGKYYPFCWYGLWTLIAISLSASQVDEAIEYARQLKKPGQQIFPQEVDSLLTGAIEAAEHGETMKSKSLLEHAVDWARAHHFI